MGEFFCPNCGADLDDQPGFSSDKGNWTCTECGQFLMDPDYDDDSAQFNGVGWFCDECGAFLNKQSGFSDWYGSWTCTECGHINNISEEEIYSSDDEYESNEQNGSEEYEGGIIGAAIYGFAKGVAEALDEYSSGMYDEEDDDCDDDGGYDEDDYYDDEDEDSSEDDPLDSAYLIYEKEKKQQLERKKSEERKAEREIRKREQEELERREQERLEHRIKVEQEKREKRALRKKRFVSAIFHGKMIDIEIASKECVGEHYLNVIKRLEKNGFTTVRMNIVEDLEMSELDQENRVTEVFLNGKDFFTITSQVKYDSDVVVTFHKLKRIAPPLSYIKAMCMNGPEVISVFQNAGFACVDEVVIKDLTFGWLKKDGQIENITIGEDRKYKTNTKYPINASVSIAYHTFKEN